MVKSRDKGKKYQVRLGHTREGEKNIWGGEMYNFHDQAAADKLSIVS